MYLLLIATAALAQKCIPLTGTTTCGELSAFAVQSTADFTDVASFDSFMNSKISDQTPDAIALQKSSLQCPGYDGRLTRYRMSVVCHSFVSSAFQTCKTGNAVPTFLCKSSCDAYLNSLEAAFVNPAVCDANPQPAMLAKRTGLLNPNIPGSIGDFCRGLPATPTFPGCSLGVKNDVSSCGFLLASDSIAFCQSNSNDPCCVSAGAAANATSAASLANAPMNSNNTWIIVGSIVGCVLLLLLLGVLLLAQRNRRARATAPKGGEVDANAGKYISKADPYTAHSPAMARKPVQSAEVNIVSPEYNQSESNYGGSNSDFGPSPYVDTAGLDDGIVKVQVIEDYIAVMDDEITGHEGDIIQVMEEFDDGWGIGKNLSTGKEGIFPFAVTRPLTGPKTPEDQKRKSVISVRHQSVMGYYN